jgi:hypothetical protein
VQVFLYKTTDIAGVDKGQLQAQILQTIFSKGVRAAAVGLLCFCTGFRITL